MKEYKIMWIDDDVNNPELRSERDALEERGCVITPLTNPDDIDFNNITSFQCIIIDLSMPTGKKLSLSETKYGTRTGLAVLEKIMKEPSKPKVIVYTVFDALDAKAYCREHKIPYWSKSEYLSDDFAESIINMINNQK